MTTEIYEFPSLHITECHPEEGGGITFSGELIVGTEGERRKAGSWRVSLFNTFGPDVVFAADCLSADAVDAYTAWESAKAKDGGAGYGWVMVIEEIRVDLEHRGHKLGHEVMRQLVATVGYGASTLIVKPGPLDAHNLSPSDIADQTAALTEYWLSAVSPSFKPCGDDAHYYLRTDCGPLSWSSCVQA